MSKRMQILMDESEFKEIRRLAKASKMTVAEWVRQVLRSARLREPGGDPAKKIQLVRAAADHSFPIGDITRVLSEIEKGYAGRDDR